MNKKRQKRRLDALQGEARNPAKRYKLPLRAVEIIEQAAKIHGQQSRAIQVAVEIIWRTVGKDYTAPPAILDTPLVGKTYGLTRRTIALIEALVREGYGTRGDVLAACAYLLELDVKTAEEWGEITPPRKTSQ